MPGAGSPNTLLEQSTPFENVFSIHLLSAPYLTIFSPANLHASFSFAHFTSSFGCSGGILACAKAASAANKITTDVSTPNKVFCIHRFVNIGNLLNGLFLIQLFLVKLIGKFAGANICIRRLCIDLVGDLVKAMQACNDQHFG